MRLALVLLGAALLGACDSGTEERDAIASTRTVQRAYTPLPAGSVARGALADLAALAPPGPPVTPQLLARGRERFQAFCSPCHGTGGRGDGPVVSRGFPAPPSYADPRVLSLGPEQIVQVVTHGKGRMFPYADRVLPEDRWAIAHHVKALQAHAASPEGTPP